MSRHLRSMLILAACSACALAARPAAAQWGDLKGKFVFDGKAPAPIKFDTSKEPACVAHNLVDESLVVAEDGSLANVVIFVRSRNVKVHPDYEKSAAEKIRFDNMHCRFEPHVLPLRLSQTLELHNSDPFSHNSNVTQLGRNRGANPILVPGSTFDYKFLASSFVPVPISCNIHPWMKGYVVPRDDPYVAVSGKDGTFEIKNLPVGKLEFQVWQEKTGYKVGGPAWKAGRFEMDVKNGVNDLGTVKLKLSE